MKLACLLLLVSMADDPTQPRLVTLNFRDRPLSEVVRSIGDQGGNPLVMTFAGLSDENVRKITLEAEKPVPFWDAVDRLCEVAKLRSQVNDTGGSGVHGWNVSLFGPETVTPSVHVYSGPFRFGNLTVHADYDRNFLRDGDRKKAITAETHFAEFEVLAEPRVIAIRTGPLEKLVATDDQGRSLLDPAIPEEQRSPVVPGYENLRSFPQLLQIKLVASRPPARRLKTLSGVMPVELGLIPKQPSQSFTLADSLGKSLKVGDILLKIEDFEVKPGEPARLTITAKIEGDRGDPKRASRSLLHGRSIALHRMIEIADEVGALPVAASSQSYDGDVARFDYTLSPRQPGAQAAPSHLRIYVPDWVAWQAPFAFSDVPLP